MSGCISSIVKHHESPKISNADIDPNVPFVTPITPQQPQNNIVPGSYELTNDIIMIIGTIIMIICFAPLLLSFLDYMIEILRDKISNLIDKTK